MSENYVEAKETSPGKKLRAIKRTVGANEVYEELIQIVEPTGGSAIDPRSVIPTVRRTISGAYMATKAFNFPSGVATPVRLFAFYNPTGSGKTLYVRYLQCWFVGTDATNFNTVPTAPTAMPLIVLLRVKTISGGTDTSTPISKKQSAYPDSIAKMIQRSTTGGAAVSFAEDPTSGAYLRRKGATNWGWLTQDLLFEINAKVDPNDEIVLKEDEGLGMTVEIAQLSNTHWLMFIEWEEA